MTKLVLALLVATALGACSDSSSGGCDYFTGECYEPDYGDYYDYNDEFIDDTYEESPYDGYGDGFDQDCSDVGEEVWVGDYDPDGLDADGDGWGCEIWP